MTELSRSTNSMNKWISRQIPEQQLTTINWILILSCFFGRCQKVVWWNVNENMATGMFQNNFTITHIQTKTNTIQFGIQFWNITINNIYDFITNWISIRKFRKNSNIGIEKFVWKIVITAMRVFCGCVWFSVKLVAWRFGFHWKSSHIWMNKMVWMCLHAKSSQVFERVFARIHLHVFFWF